MIRLVIRRNTRREKEVTITTDLSRIQKNNSLNLKYWAIQNPDILSEADFFQHCSMATELNGHWKHFRGRLIDSLSDEERSQINFRRKATYNQYLSAETQRLTEHIIAFPLMSYERFQENYRKKGGESRKFALKVSKREYEDRWRLIKKRNLFARKGNRGYSFS